MKYYYWRDSVWGNKDTKLNWCLKFMPLVNHKITHTCTEQLHSSFKSTLRVCFNTTLVVIFVPVFAALTEQFRCWVKIILCMLKNELGNVLLLFCGNVLLNTRARFRNSVDKESPTLQNATNSYTIDSFSGKSRLWDESKPCELYCAVTTLLTFKRHQSKCRSGEDSKKWWERTIREGERLQGWKCSKKKGIREERWGKGLGHTGRYAELRRLAWLAFHTTSVGAVTAKPFYSEFVIDNDHQ